MKLQLTAKCSDLCFCSLIDDEGDVVKEKDGYVPEGLGIGGGDYVEFTVDLKTGQIENWKPVKDLKKAKKALEGP